MDAKTYRTLALRTENRDLAPVQKRGSGNMMTRLRHAAYGLQTESAEFTDALKRFEFYGTELDQVNLMEEVGDILWYANLALESIGYTMEEAMERNIAKLSARYPDKFTEYNAEHRDLDKERAILNEKVDENEDNYSKDIATLGIARTLLGITKNVPPAVTEAVATISKKTLDDNYASITSSPDYIRIPDDSDEEKIAVKQKQEDTPEFKAYLDKLAPSSRVKTSTTPENSLKKTIGSLIDKLEKGQTPKKSKKK